MDYDDFAERFLIALHYETEQGRGDYHRADNLLTKYDMHPKPHWISRMADDWEHQYFRDVSKVLGGYGGWSFRISAEGSRKVESQFRDEQEIEQFLRSADDGIDSLSQKFAQASDRMVLFSDNSAPLDKVVAGVGEISGAIAASNAIDPAEKADVLESLSLAERLVTKSKTVFVGALRYLIVERVKAALEGVIEDALKVVIVASLTAIIIAIMAVL